MTHPVTHLAVVEHLNLTLDHVAGGSEQHCRDSLERWLARHPLQEWDRAMILEILTVTEPLDVKGSEAA